jgi:hypothetical protein
LAGLEGWLAERFRRYRGNADVDTNAYSVPWRLIGESVRVVVSGGRVSVLHDGREVAIHADAGGRRQRLIEATHFAGLSSLRPTAPAAVPEAPAADLLRPAAGVRAACRGRLVMADHDALLEMLSRLKLTAIRDQLDSLLDEAARQQLTLREAVALLCQREVARKNERRIEMASKIAHFPTVRDLQGFDFAARPLLDRGQIRELAHGDAVLATSRASTSPRGPC